jgi:hypothetical protein
MQGRVAVLLLAVVAATSLAAGVLVAVLSDTVVAPATAKPKPPAERKASRFVAPNGSDARSCRTQRTACASFARAYRSARPGQVIEVAGGRYPSQEILADPRKNARTRHVVFRPARGATVELEGLTLGSGENLDGPRHLTFAGMRTTFASAGVQNGIEAMPGTRDVVWRNMDAGNFNLWGVQRFRIKGGDWGPCAIGPNAPCSNAKIDAGPPGAATRRVLVDDATFHDFRFSPACFEGGEDCHFECMYVNGGSDVTIRGSRFRDCALYDIFVTLSGEDAARVGQRNLTIERNRFSTPWDESGPDSAQKRRFSALALNWCQNSPLGYENVRIHANRFDRNTGILLDPNPECRFENVRVTANRMAWDGCDDRWSYKRNRWTTEIRRGRCDRSDRIVRR